MQCSVCGGSYTERTDRFTYNDPVVGPVFIQGIKYYRCEKCGDILFTIEMSNAIESEISERKKQFINNLPIRDFITAKETANLLGVTRQALNKNRRIKKGFIHYANIGESIIYVRKSVIQFHRAGDGRYPLYSSRFKDYSLLPAAWK